MNPVIFRVLLSTVCLLTPAMAQLRTPPAAKPPASARPVPGAQAEPDTTALGAIAAIPKDAAANVARVEGPDGHPFPERWYVLVHDSAAPRGLREFVVSGGKLVTGRTLSQFADVIGAEDVIAAGTVKINNDQAAGIAAQFAMANGKQMSSIRYELSKTAVPGVPAWRLTCTGPDGQTIGSIDLHANKGSVLGFQGFEKSPLPVEPESASDQPATTGSAVATKSTKPAPTSSGATTASNTKEKPPVRAMPVKRQPTPAPKQGPIDKIGNTFRRIFR